MDAKITRFANMVLTAITVAMGYYFGILPGFVMSVYLIYKWVWKGKAPYFQILK